MISGLGISSSGIATAVRTASTARATMDTMGREIATGQRVASAKDDGAAWTRMAALKSQKVTVAGRQEVLDRIDMQLTYTDAGVQQAIAGLDRLRELTITARQYAAGSSQRAALQAEWAQTLTWSNQGGATPDFVHSATHWDQSSYNNFGYDYSAVDAQFAGNRWAISYGTAAFAGWYSFAAPVALTSVDLATASDAQLTDAFTSATAMRDQAQGRWGISVGQDLNLVDRLQSLNSAEANRLDRAIGSLSDADLGKASAARAQAQARQQLALSTVRQALDAYGAFAGGLLGNVQRTQRGISA
jgi:flagellin